jgi:hypothetical protein
MNNKANIFEELNKMKSLIHAKAGTVISEQLLNSAGQPQIKPGVGAGGKLTSNQMLVSSKGFGTVDAQMADQLVKLGNISQLTFLTPSQISSLKDQAKKELEKVAADAEATRASETEDTRRKSIQNNYCSVKNGKIENPNLSFNGRPWEDFVKVYTITDQEIRNVKVLCPNVVVPDVATPYKFGDDLSKALNIQGTGNTQKGNTNNVNTRFKKSATDLGVQSDKMDLQTLQSILAKLQDDGSQSTVTQSTSTTTQQTPDLTQLTTLLNQLNA